MTEQTKALIEKLDEGQKALHKRIAEELIQSQIDHNTKQVADLQAQIAELRQRIQDIRAL